MLRLHQSNLIKVMFFKDFTNFQSVYYKAFFGLLIVTYVGVEKINNKSAFASSSISHPSSINYSQSNASKANSKNSQSEQQIKAILYRNLQGVREENIELVMLDIDKKSPDYKKTRDLAIGLFNLYDLQYAMNRINIINVSQSEAKARTIITTKKINGPEFRDNMVTSIHTLKKTNGQWKIFSTTIENVKFLN
jgi:hypothetical protein